MYATAFNMLLRVIKQFNRIIIHATGLDKLMNLFLERESLKLYSLIDLIRALGCIYAAALKNQHYRLEWYDILAYLCYNFFRRALYIL